MLVPQDKHKKHKQFQNTKKVKTRKKVYQFYHFSHMLFDQKSPALTVPVAEGGDKQTQDGNHDL